MKETLIINRAPKAVKTMLKVNPFYGAWSADSKTEGCINGKW
jgi:monomeric isocitrate dehydrogenase